MSWELLQDIAERAVDASEDVGKERDKEEQEIIHVSGEQEKEESQEGEIVVTEKLKEPNKQKQKKHRNQDIRDLIKRKKEQACERREQSNRNKEDITFLIRDVEREEQEDQEECASIRRAERRKRADLQKQELLNEIRSKMERAKQMKKVKDEDESRRIMSRCARIGRAATQRI